MKACNSFGVVAALLLLTGIAHADPCKVTIESNDAMQYNMHEMVVPASCTEVEVSLRHSGQLAAKVMGHDWVLAREADMSGIVNAGMAAGFKHGYLPENDKRIIAATKVVGGGESATVTFSTSALQEGVRYVFFCTSPGHSSAMHGSFRFGEPAKAP
jgi:azurin